MSNIYKYAYGVAGSNIRDIYSSDIESLLKDLNIHASIIHDGDNTHIEGVLTKNVFLIDKKYGLFLITTIPTRDINMKQIGNLLSLSDSNLRFCDEELLVEKLRIRRELLNPFALMNDAMNNIICCIDNELLKQSFIHLRPLQYDRMTSITPTDLLSFLKHINHTPNILTF